MTREGMRTPGPHLTPVSHSATSSGFIAGPPDIERVGEASQLAGRVEHQRHLVTDHLADMKHQRRLLAITPVDISKTGMMLLNNACGILPCALLMIAYQVRRAAAAARIPGGPLGS